jgi:hypothetical protein
MNWTRVWSIVSIQIHLNYRLIWHTNVLNFIEVFMRRAKINSPFLMKEINFLFLPIKGHLISSII